MFVMDYYGHKLSNGVLFAHHLILDVPGGSSHLGYRRRVPPGHNPRTRVLRSINPFIRSWLVGQLYFSKHVRVTDFFRWHVQQTPDGDNTSLRN